MRIIKYLNIKKPYRINIGGVIFLTMLSVGCAPASFVVSPITEQPGTAYLPGKFVWYDLLAEDPAAVQSFYAGLFGWVFEDTGEGYTVIRNGDRAIGGMVQVDDARVDQASARYAEFGPFYAGYIATPAEILDHCRIGVAN